MNCNLPPSLYSSCALSPNSLLCFALRNRFVLLSYTFLAFDNVYNNIIQVSTIFFFFDARIVHMLHPRFITSRFFFPRWKLFLLLSSRSQTAHQRLERGEKSAGTLATQTTSLIIFFFSQSRDSGKPSHLYYYIAVFTANNITA